MSRAIIFSIIIVLCITIASINYVGQGSVFYTLIDQIDFEHAHGRVSRISNEFSKNVSLRSSVNIITSYNSNNASSSSSKKGSFHSIYINSSAALATVDIPAPVLPKIWRNRTLRSNAIFLNFHITHHGGTSLYRLAKSNGLNCDGMNSNFNIDCMEMTGSVCNMKILPSKPIVTVMRVSSKEDTMKLWTSPLTQDLKSWGLRNESLTIPSGNLTRQYISMEQVLFNTTWAVLPIDNDRIYSMIAMRNPIARSLTFGGDANRSHLLHHGWEHHLLHLHIDNYALRYLSGYTYGTKLIQVPAHLLTNSTNELGYVLRKTIVEDQVGIDAYNVAVERLRMFDHVVILEAFDDSIRFMCDEWKWTYCKGLSKERKYEDNGKIPQHPRIAINDDSLFKRYLDKEYWNFKLYDYAVQLALQYTTKMNNSRQVLSNIPIDSRQYLLNHMKKYPSISDIPKCNHTIEYCFY